MILLSGVRQLHRDCPVLRRFHPHCAPATRAVHAYRCQPAAGLRSRPAVRPLVPPACPPEAPALSALGLREALASFRVRNVVLLLFAPYADWMPARTAQAFCAANASRRRCQVTESSSGSTRVSPVTVMKLVSPTQRGTACRCR